MFEKVKKFFKKNYKNPVFIILSLLIIFLLGVCVFMGAICVDITKDVLKQEEEQAQQVKTPEVLLHQPSDEGSLYADNGDNTSSSVNKNENSSGQITEVPDKEKVQAVVSTVENSIEMDDATKIAFSYLVYASSLGNLNLSDQIQVESGGFLQVDYDENKIVYCVDLMRTNDKETSTHYYYFIDWEGNVKVADPGVAWWVWSSDDDAYYSEIAASLNVSLENLSEEDVLKAATLRAEYVKLLETDVVNVEVLNNALAQYAEGMKG